VRLALDFQPWARLTAGGLSDLEAADVMAKAARTAGSSV
jgi:hypothetical protein